MDVVVSGIMAGTNGSSGTTGAGACAGTAFFLFFLAFFLPITPAAAARQQSTREINRSHCQSRKKTPEEPDAMAPELVAEPDTSLVLEPGLKELSELEDIKEALESVPEEAEESHAVMVVVTTIGASVVVSDAAEAIVRASMVARIMPKGMQPWKDSSSTSSKPQCLCKHLDPK